MSVIADSCVTCDVTLSCEYAGDGFQTPNGNGQINWDRQISLWRMNDENHPLILVAAVVVSFDIDSLGLGGNGRAVTFISGKLGR